VGAELEDEEEAAAHAFQALGIAEGEGAQEQNAPNAGVCIEGTAPTPQEVAAVVAQCREEVAAGAAQCEAQRHPEGALPPCTGAAAGGARPADAVLQRYAESGAQALRTFLQNVEKAKQLRVVTLDSPAAIKGQKQYLSALKPSMARGAPGWLELLSAGWSPHERKKTRVLWSNKRKRSNKLTSVVCLFDNFLEWSNKPGGQTNNKLDQQ